MHSTVFRSSFRIVLMPYPLPPESVLVYHLYRRLGLFGEDVQVYYDWRPETFVAQGMLSKEVFKFAGLNVRHQFEHLAAQLPPQLRRSTRRFFEFLRSRGRSSMPVLKEKKGGCVSHSLQALNASRMLRRMKPVIKISPPPPALPPGAWNFDRLLRYLGTFWLEPRLLLESLHQSIARCLDEGRDPLRDELDLPEVAACNRAVSLQPLSRLFVNRPKFADQDSTKPEGQEIFAFQEHSALRLLGQHLGVVVVGDPGVGKSTIAAALLGELQVQLASLRSRREWRGYDLSVGYVNLDLGTPTVEAILGLEGQDRESLCALKREWTAELAFEATERFVEAKRRYNILIADMPGRITDITRIISGPADGGVVVYNRTMQLRPWYDFLAQMGVDKLATIRTSRGRKTPESLVRSHHGPTVFGSVIGVERVPRSWDSFIKYYALVLLFEQAPGLIDRRQRQFAARLKKL